MSSIFKNKKVIITGHTGFKGSWLSAWLHSLGANVVGISKDIPTNPSHYETIDLKSKINEYLIDIENLAEFKKIIISENPDFVFHLAAQALVRPAYANPVETWKTNTIGTVNLLESLRHISNRCIAILITSDKCYDNVEWVWGYRETDAIGGPDPYSASKGGAEIAIKSYVKSYFDSTGNVRIGIGRAGNVIGGGDWADDRIIPDCVKAWSQGEVVELRNPHATRPWQHVLEPLSGYITLAINLVENGNNHGEAFNFGPTADNNNSVLNLVSSMSSYWKQVNWKDTSSDNEGPYESGLLKLNCDKALHKLNWHAVWNFEKTVENTSEWYKRFYNGKYEDIYKITIDQIKEYTIDANAKNLEWPQKI